MPGATLSIGDLAERTGVSVATLRAWESRFGFPTPERRASGHRRYQASDVDAIERVLRERAQGLSLISAVRRERDAATTATGSPTIFGALHRAEPSLESHILRKRTMFAISRAIEDEALATGRSTLLAGCFQEERFYRESLARWRELSRTADAALVFADFTSRRSRARRPVEVALRPDSVLRREWVVVCDGPNASAVLAGWERPVPRRTSDRRRRFEAVWSADPRVVRAAALAALALAADNGADRVLPPDGLPPVPADPDAALRRATRLTNRIVAYLR